MANQWSLVVILLLVITIIILTYIIIYLYKWRIKTADDSQVVVVPEEIFRCIDGNSKEIKVLNKLTNSVSSSIQNNLCNLSDNSNKSFSTIIDFLSTIQNIAEDRSKEIDRYRNGYDYCNTKIFLKSIIRIIDQIDEYLSKVDQNNDFHDVLDDIKDEILILLENNHIEEMLPITGSKYSSTSPDYKVVKRIEAPSSDLEMTIKEVVKTGYKLNISDEQSKIIREAEVVIFSNTKAEGADNE